MTLRGREVAGGDGYNAAVARLYLVTDPDVDPDTFGLGTLDITGPGAVPDELVGIFHAEGQMGPEIEGDLSGFLRYADSVSPGNAEGCDPFPPDVFVDAVALIERGGCNFADKVGHASDAGALAAVVYNNQGNELVTMTGDPQPIASTFIGEDDGWNVVDWILDNPGQVTVTIHPAQ